MSEDDSVRLDTRLAGQVRRYHTWPIVSHQTIGEHCWQLLRIYLCVVDRIDPHMVNHITFHDIGEHFTGDIPYPVKRDNPILKEQMDFLEQRSQACQMDYWNSFRQIVLTDDDKKLFKQIELIEMAEFGMDQMNLGNHHGYIIANRCLEAVYKNQPCAKLAQYVTKRLQLFFEQCHPTDAICDEIEWWWYRTWERLSGDSKSEASGRDPL
jgi:5'-deoxynucleotidase YfbR-like HD superfamily hydrolase